MLLSLLSKRTLGADSRDTYGFTVRPQHLERYREYANIYKEEEAERLDKWTRFLDQQTESCQQLALPEEIDGDLPAVVDEREREIGPHLRVKGDDSSEENSTSPKKDVTIPLGDDSSEENSNSPKKEVQKTFGDASSEENSTSPKKKILNTLGDDSSEENLNSPKNEVQKPLGDDSIEENSNSPKKEVQKTFGDDSSEENSNSPKKEVLKTLGDDSSEENSNSPKKEVLKTLGDDSSEENLNSPKKEVPKPLGDDSSEENSNSPKKEVLKTLGDDSSEENLNSPNKEVPKPLGDDSSEENSTSPKKKVPKPVGYSSDENSTSPKKEIPKPLPTKYSKVLSWDKLSPSLHVIENIMRYRIKKRNSMKIEHTTTDHLPSIDEVRTSRGESEEEDEEECYDKEILEDVKSASSVESAATDEVSPDSFFHLKQELEFLVHGGVPRNLRGEVWQAFVGVRARRVEGYYQNFLAPESDQKDAPLSEETGNGNMALNKDFSGVPVKWRKQIEKDLHRTFPGHPALDENGRSSLRRVLLAYAQHNPSVGYCQAMNFFAGLLLLMMPEENAFWTLVGIMDDYFDGYYSEQMIESQVDQLVFEELMRQRFPKLVNHLDYLGVQVAWISGPWFLSIFVNMLPWESVLRIWDVILFEGNRVMLFRSALALMELYGPALVTTKDAGDAITLLQSLAGSTFDSSQLVLTACMGFLAVTEDKLQELREKHRPAVIEIVKERSKGEVSKGSKSLATKLASFKHGPGSVIKEANEKLEADTKFIDGDISIMDSAALDSFLNGLTIDTELGSVPDIEEQVVWLKVNLCKLLDEKRSAILRAEELETALMEMVKQDNRRQLSAKAEQLEEVVAELRQALSDKIEQENAMLKLLMRVEQEQKVTEDARLFAEQDAAAQRFAVQMLEEKYEKAMASIAQMEKRVVMAESTLEATLQYERGQGKAQSSPRAVRPDTPKEVPTRRIGLLSFGLGWRNRGLQSNAEEPSETKSTSDGQSTSTGSTTTTAQQEPEK